MYVLCVYGAAQVTFITVNITKYAPARVCNQACHKRRNNGEKVRLWSRSRPSRFGIHVIMLLYRNLIK